MKKDQVIILEKRGVVLISGDDASNFLQNIITNDIKRFQMKIYFCSYFNSTREIS